MWACVVVCAVILLGGVTAFIQARATRLPYERIGSGYLGRTEPGGPLVSYNPGGELARAIHPEEKQELAVREVELELVNEATGERLRKPIRVIEREGKRWLSAPRGTNPLIKSPVRDLYFTEANRLLYLVDPDKLGAKQLTSSSYRGRPMTEFTRNEMGLVFWVASPIWGPGGDSVIFETNRSGQWELWEVNVNTGEEQVLAVWDGRPVGTTRAGHIVTVRQSAPDWEVWLLKPDTGENVLAVRAPVVYAAGAFAVARFDSDSSSRLVFHNLNEGTSAKLPPAPEGYDYCLPFSVSPDGTGVALWLSTAEGDSMLGILDVTTDPAKLKTYPPPGGRHTGAVYWLDNTTVAVQTGLIGDPTAGTYSLKVR